MEIVVNKDENKATFTTFFKVSNVEKMVEFVKGLGKDVTVKETKKRLREELNPYKKAKNTPIDWSSAHTYYVIIKLREEGFKGWDLCEEASKKLVGDGDSNMAVYMRLPQIFDQYISFKELDHEYSTEEEAFKKFSELMAKQNVIKKQKRLPIGTKVVFGEKKIVGEIVGYDEENGDYKIKTSKSTVSNIFRKEIELV